MFVTNLLVELNSGICFHTGPFRRISKTIKQTMIQRLSLKIKDLDLSVLSSMGF